ncbi:MAG: hypothetical protein LBT80_03135 [Lactobacillaceae bacterium]|jgi:hypothetical protein|nr:hypothetical protein [Lactobacillaceae bacterium]
MNEEFDAEKFRILVDRAHAAHDDMQIDKTLDLLEEAYNMHQEPELNHFVTAVLLDDGQNQLAQQIADEFVDSYANDRQLAEQYLAIAFNNRNYLQAREFALSTRWSDEFTTIIGYEEHQGKIELGETIQTIARHFWHLSDQDVATQQARIDEAEHLPLADYLKGAKFVLRDPFLHPIVRVTVLNRLRRLQVNEPIIMHWLRDTEITVNPSELVEFEEQPAFQAILQILNEHANNSDVAVNEAVLAGLRLTLLQTYPLVDKVVTDPASWVQATIAEVSGDTDIDEPNQQREWRLELQKLAMDLLA